MRNILAISLSAFLLSACAATNFFIPGNRFITPETSGHFGGGEARAGGVGVVQVEVTPDMTIASPDTNPDLSKNSAVSSALSLGLFSFVDLYFHNVIGAPPAVGLNIQLLGAPKNEAKGGNFSFSIAGGAITGDSKLTATSGSTAANSKLKYSGWEGMALLGYRANDIVLFYGGPFKTHIDADITIQRTSSGVTSTTAQPNGEGDMKGATVGIRFGYHFFVDLEVSKTETQWIRNDPTISKSEKYEDTALGLSLGGAW